MYMYMYMYIFIYRYGKSMRKRVWESVNTIGTYTQTRAYLFFSIFFFLFTECSPITNSTRLIPREMFRLSSRIGRDWKILGRYLGISKAEMEDVRTNNTMYPRETSEAEKMLELYNHREDFSRMELAFRLEEMQLCDLKDQVINGTLRNM